MLMGLIALSIAMAYVYRDIVRIRESQIITGFDGQLYNMTSYEVKPSGDYRLVKINHWIPHDPSGRLL